MGAPVDFLAVVAVESFVCAVKSAAVIVPAGLGVQEATYAVLSPLLGVGADIGLAVSLLKRARDIALGVPVLLIWQAVEGRRAFSRGQFHGAGMRPRARNHCTASANACTGGRQV